MLGIRNRLRMVARSWSWSCVCLPFCCAICILLIFFNFISAMGESSFDKIYINNIYVII